MAKNRIKRFRRVNLPELRYHIQEKKEKKRESHQLALSHVPMEDISLTKVIRNALINWHHYL